MLSTRTRTIIAVLVASLGFSASAVAPTISQAQKIKKESPAEKAYKKKSHEEFCGDMSEMLQGDVEEYENSMAEGNTDEANNYLKEAMEDLKTAKTGGCGWAAHVRLPGSKTERAPIGPANGEEVPPPVSKTGPVGGVGGKES